MDYIYPRSKGVLIKLTFAIYHFLCGFASDLVLEKTEKFKTLTKEEKEYRRYEIPETISIWICDFELPHCMENYIDELAIYSKEMLNRGTIETVFPKNKYIMVNLTRFNKTAEEVKDPVDMWLYVLKHAHEGKPLPDFGNDIANEALNRIKIENLDKTTLTELEREMIAKEEIECRLAGAKIETRYKTKLEMVDAMFANSKLTDEDISAISRISLAEIKKCRAQR